jgi:PAS domain S-box-containing protein
VAAFVTDISARKRAEAALQASEARLRAIVENEPELVKVVAPDGKILEMNSAGLELLEVESVAEIGDITQFVEPQDRAAFLDLHRRVIGGEPASLAFRLTGRRGTRRWIETNATPLRNEHGEVIALLGVARDVTERKRAEQAIREQTEILQTVFDQIPVLIEFHDSEGNVQRINRELERTLGWSLEEMQRHPDIMAALYPDPETRRQATRFMLDAEPGWREFRTMTRDGRSLDILWANVRLSDGTGIGFGQDITARKHLEIQLNQSQKLESIGRLAGGVAHDFNNLLTVILGYTEILQHDAPDRLRRSEELEEIRQAALRARDLTIQLLAFARRQVIAPRIVDPNELATAMERLLRRLLGEDIELVTRLESDPWPIQADPAQLEQVIMNLAVNARDAMPEGGTLTIETRNEALSETHATRIGVEAGSYLVLAVTDTGVGMSPETMEHLFEPFFTTKGPGKGTGLGLATVYGVVRQNGGHIRVSSELDRGTTFEMRFPRAAERVVVESSDAVPSLLRGRETVLVVEDDAPVRVLTIRSLRKSGYRVLAASSGREALEVAAHEAGPIDLLITDLVMPGMGGREVARLLGAERPALRILFVSGYTRDSLTVEGVAGDGGSFLPKPFTPLQLFETVRRILDRPTEPASSRRRANHRRKSGA